MDRDKEHPDQTEEIHREEQVPGRRIGEGDGVPSVPDDPDTEPALPGCLAAPEPLEAGEVSPDDGIEQEAEDRHQPGSRVAPDPRCEAQGRDGEAEDEPFGQRGEGAASDPGQLVIQHHVFRRFDFQVLPVLQCGTTVGHVRRRSGDGESAASGQ